jgi:hypothetical protein
MARMMADDDFIEIQNTDCNKPIDITDWRIELTGDVKADLLRAEGG